MPIDFSVLPFACRKESEAHRLSEQCVEFFEEPKLRLHKYGEINRPYLSNWLAITSEWFPENKYMVFDSRVLMNTSEFKLPYNNDEVLPYLARAIAEQYERLIDFLNKVVETKNIDVSEVVATNRKCVDNIVSKEWAAMQSVSQHFVSLFYQTEKVEDFIDCCMDLDSEFDARHLKVIWECLSEVYRSENALLKIDNKDNS